MSINRRNFIGYSVAGLGSLAFSAKSYSRIVGANERINIGFMGTQSRGAGLLGSFARMAGVNVTHNCDVDSRVLKRTHNAIIQAGFDTPKSDKDIRKILEDPLLDALVIAAPDHWHATAGVMALEAGKHVYVEKPLSHNPHEGEIFVSAQKKYNKIVQMGNQQRSSDESIEFVGLIRQGLLGNVYRAETWYGNNRGSIGNGKVSALPDWLDWSLWQGLRLDALIEIIMSTTIGIGFGTGVQVRYATTLLMNLILRVGQWHLISHKKYQSPRGEISTRAMIGKCMTPWRFAMIFLMVKPLSGWVIAAIKSIDLVVAEVRYY